MKSRIQKRENPNDFRLARAGRIKIGEKNAAGIPTSLDYFRVDAPAKYVKMVSAKYGEKPDTLQIVFHTEDEGEVLKNFYELRDPKTGKTIAKGDGKSFELNRVKDGAPFTTYEEPQDPVAWMQALAEKTAGKWRERLRMRFLLLGVEIFGVWELSTGAEESTIPGILSAVDSMRALCGRISGIPFDLIVKKVKGDKAGPARTFPVVSLIGKFSAEDVESVKQLKGGFGLISKLSEVPEIAAPNTSTNKVLELPLGT